MPAVRTWWCRANRNSPDRWTMHWPCWVSRESFQWSCRPSPTRCRSCAIRILSDSSRIHPLAARRWAIMQKARALSTLNFPYERPLSPCRRFGIPAYMRILPTVGFAIPSLVFAKMLSHKRVTTAWKKEWCQGRFTDRAVLAEPRTQTGVRVDLLTPASKKVHSHYCFDPAPALTTVPAYRSCAERPSRGHPGR